jgi:hypothetical protein
MFQNWSLSPNTRKGWAIAFQSLILLFCIVGIAILLFDSKSISGALNMFSYYTIQSNLLVAAAMVLGIWGLAKGHEDSSLFVIFKSGAMLWILVTGIVYHLMLSGLWHPGGLTAFANLLVHYCTPLGMLLNWLIFEKKGRYRYVFSFYWLSYPFLYLIGSWLRGGLTGFYPYWFLNPTQPYPDGAGSMGTMLMIASVLSLGFYSIGLLIVFMDKLLARNLKSFLSIFL